MVRLNSSCDPKLSLCGTDCNNLYSCGWGGYFQLGTGTNEDRTEPDDVDVGEIEVETVAAGRWASYFISTTGILYCAGLKAWTGKPWIHEASAQIWAPTIEQIDLPGKVLKVVVGSQLAAAIVSSQEGTSVYRWGDVWPPQLVVTLPEVDQLSATPWGIIFTSNCNPTNK